MSTDTDHTKPHVTDPEEAPMTTDRPHYKEPDWFTRHVFNRLVNGLTRLGVSVRGSRVLEHRGRTTGELHHTPVNLLTIEGTEYLVAPRGETQWVRNVRHAGGHLVLIVGRRRAHCNATEVPAAERIPILRAYLRRWKFVTGMFFDGNVYDRSQTDGHLRPDPLYVNADGSIGQAKYVRVLEAIPLPRNGNLRGGPIGNTDFEKQKLLGYGSVRSDGSFAIQVPANRSIHIQTLDEHGVMLVNQITWIQVMPGETRLCTGCHDSHDRDKVINDFQITSAKQIYNTALGKTYDAGFNNAEYVMAHPAARTDTVDFFDRSNTGRTNTVQAVFNARCVSCHGGSAPAGGLTLQLQSSDMVPQSPNQNSDGTTTVYDTLTNEDRYRTKQGQLVTYATQSGGRVSPLIWVMFNTQLNDPTNSSFRPLSFDHTTIWTKDQYNRVDPFLAANRDLLTIIEWVDMGLQYSNTVAPQ